MSKEAIEKVRAAEEEAAAIKRGAGDKVKALLDAEEKKGRLLKDNAEGEAKSARSRILAEAGQKAAKITEEGLKSSNSEAEKIRAEAEKNLPAAVEIILKGVDAMCR